MFVKLFLFPVSWVFLAILPYFTFSQQELSIEYLDRENIIIQEEKLSISVAGKKAYLIDVQVDRQISYKINNQEGVNYLDTIIIPEPFDETYILHAPEIRKNIGSISGFKIIQFSALVEKPDGSIIPVNPGMNVISSRIITNSLGVAYQNEYHFTGLQPGDVLKLSYTYTFPFRQNWFKLFSTRIFFHSRYPRLLFDFDLTHSSNLPVDTFLVNVSAPDFMEQNGNKTYSWHMVNLPGCLDEPGCRPYKELPHFIFSLKPYELLYQHFNSFKQEFVPLWYFLCYDREQEIRSAVTDNSIGAKDKDNLAYEKIAKRFIAMSGDDLNGIKTLQYFQRWMVDSVMYDNSAMYYDNQENYMLSRPAPELQGGVLKDYAIELTYANMILKLGLNFFTAYPVDIRCGEISREYFSPMYDNDLIFAAVLKNNLVAYVLPFSEFNKLYCEELPFYYEDTPVMLINSRDFGGYKLNLLDSARILKTPESLVTENSRNTRSKVSVALDADSMLINSSITLSGQYSTLCRFPYLDKPADKSVNPLYHQKVWEIGGDVSVRTLKVSKTDLFFPFTTKVDAEYSCQNLIEKTNAGYRIELKNWINHVIPAGYDTVFRFTDFYSDFTGSDNYFYNLVFDKNIQLGEVSRNYYFMNEFGSYTFAIMQINENTIQISSKFSLKSRVISKDNVFSLFKMFHAIESCRNIEFLVKPKQ